MTQRLDNDEAPSLDAVRSAAFQKNVSRVPFPRDPEPALPADNPDSARHRTAGTDTCPDESQECRKRHAQATWARSRNRSFHGPSVHYNAGAVQIQNRVKWTCTVFRAAQLYL